MKPDPFTATVTTVVLVSIAATLVALTSPHWTPGAGRGVSSDDVSRQRRLLKELKDLQTPLDYLSTAVDDLNKDLNQGLDQSSNQSSSQGFISTAAPSNGTAGNSTVAAAANETSASNSTEVVFNGSRGNILIGIDALLLLCAKPTGYVNGEALGNVTVDETGAVYANGTALHGAWNSTVLRNISGSSSANSSLDAGNSSFLGTGTYYQNAILQPDGGIRLTSAFVLANTTAVIPCDSSSSSNSTNPSNFAGPNQFASSAQVARGTAPVVVQRAGATVTPRTVVVPAVTPRAVTPRTVVPRTVVPVVTPRAPRAVPVVVTPTRVPLQGAKAPGARPAVRAPLTSPYNLTGCNFIVGPTSGYKKIQQVLDAIRNNALLLGVPKVVCVLPGVYRENLHVSLGMDGITLRGFDRKTTTIVAGLWQRTGAEDPTKQATLIVDANNFHAENIKIENSHKNVSTPSPAVAMNGFTSSWVNVAMLAWSDTLFIKASNHYFKDCFIAGLTDMIWGYGRAAFVNPVIFVRFYYDPNVVYTGHIATFGTNTYDSAGVISGAVFYNATIYGSGLAHLGQAYRPQVQVAYINCYMGSAVAPTGWGNLFGMYRPGLTQFQVYNSRGPGANPKQWQYGRVVTGPVPAAFGVKAFIGRVA